MIKSTHHPFTAPHPDDVTLLMEAQSIEDLLKVRNDSFEWERGDGRGFELEGRVCAIILNTPNFIFTFPLSNMHSSTHFHTHTHSHRAYSRAYSLRCGGRAMTWQ